MSLIVEWNSGKALTALEMIKSQRLAFKAGNAAAKTYQQEILDYIRSGASFTSSGGKRTEKSIKWSFDGPGARIFTHARRAVWIEQGTGIHGPLHHTYEIWPWKAKALRLKLASGARFAAHIKAHPGMRARPFFFSDFPRREARMLAAAAAVIERKLAEAAA